MFKGFPPWGGSVYPCPKVPTTRSIPPEFRVEKHSVITEPRQPHRKLCTQHKRCNLCWVLSGIWGITSCHPLFPVCEQAAPLGMNWFIGRVTMAATPVGTACPCKVGAPGSSTGRLFTTCFNCLDACRRSCFENKSGVSPHALACKRRNTCLDTSPTWERRCGFSP